MFKKKTREAIGRSSGGLSTKIHATVDALGNPVNFYLTQGQCSDLEGAEVLISELTAPMVLADKAYDADARMITPLKAVGRTAVIPSKKNRKQPRDYDKYLYKERHLVETFFCKLKQFRAIATRYDKSARNLLAAIHLAASVIWLA